MLLQQPDYGQWGTTCWRCSQQVFAASCDGRERRAPVMCHTTVGSSCANAAAPLEAC